ncbi:MAG: lysylphosphatidylglycerol synthase transmembrane domain-containing protein [Gaiellaceae bacterium]
MARVLDGIDAFLDQIGSVEVTALLLAVLCHLLKMGCTSRAWRNVLAAAYPRTPVRWRDVYGAYLAGVGVNAIVPVRGGDAVRIYLAHRAVPHSTYTTVISSTLVLTIFDLTAATLLFAWAVSVGALPGLDVLPRLESFDFAFLLDRPLAFELTLAGAFVGLAVLGVWVHGHVRNFWGRVRQAFSVLRPPTLYLRRVAVWQAGDWLLRLATIWFLLDAYDIPQSLHNAALVQVSQSTATILPITPSGLGTEQAFLLYVLSGVAPASVLLAFSVAARLTITAVNVVAGFTAIAITMRTVRYAEVVGKTGARSRELQSRENP